MFVLKRSILQYTSICLIGFIAVISFAPMTAKAQSGAADNVTDLSIRMTQLEAIIRELTGKIEQLNHMVGMVQQDARNALEENDYRLRRLEQARGDIFPQQDSISGAGEQTSAAATSSGSEEVPAMSVEDERRLSEVAAQDTQLSGNVPSNSEDLDEQSANMAGAGQSNGEEIDQPLAESGQPIDLYQLARGEFANENSKESGPSAALPSHSSQDSRPGGSSVNSEDIALLGDPSLDYDAAYVTLLDGDYEEARLRFDKFLSLYPSHEFSANAQFWIGETYMATKEYRAAADAFLKSYSEYPNSSKRAESLLKLSMALRHLGEKMAACATLGELLSTFPQAPPAIRANAITEQELGQCQA